MPGMSALYKQMFLATGKDDTSHIKCDCVGQKQFLILITMQYQCCCEPTHGTRALHERMLAESGSLT